jgi:hypothetical protein
VTAAAVVALVATTAAAKVGDAAREAFFMFWDTLWALVLGFGLSGAVQAFVSKHEMERVLGDHRPAAVARASGLGMVSSSCSYAASAMAKSLFEKGADFTTSMIFMFASTNLVVELGVVLVVLLGWQFAAAELIGGPIMIVMLAAVGGAVFGPRVVARARAHLRRGAAAPERDDEGATVPADASWRDKLTSAAGWSDAAGYAIADLTMLRVELVIGYAVAGILAVVVPVHVWSDVFVTGHGPWTTFENAAVGPLIACISFVCSVGNVALAAALWHGGISFGGVISFVFADLVALPLLLVYRKYYGTAMALRLLATFWVLMTIAGLAVESLFSAAGLVPNHRPVTIVASHFSWNATTFLNIVAVGAFAALVWLARNRSRLGGAVHYAIDPVCGMQVDVRNAPARSHDHGGEHFFCSDRCRERFARAGSAAAG